MMKRLAAVLLAMIACAAFAQVAPPVPRALAPGVWLIPGGFLPGRQPDGNTIVFEGATGLVVMDTGRHAWHRDAIIGFARERKRPVVAIVNSHWHLDHTSGNEAIKRAWPQAKVYASGALDRIVRDVWPGSTANLQAYLASGKAPPDLAEDLRGDIHAQTHPDAMRADVTIAASGAREIAGRPFDVHLAANAATDGDVWLFDPRTRVLAAGDLVTFPVPFLDTACVAGWRAALKEIEAAPFDVLVPGHGEPMDREHFVSYRAAFEDYAACARSTADKSQCAAKWISATTQSNDARAREMAEDYVDLLRRGGGNSALCRAP